MNMHLPRWTTALVAGLGLAGWLVASSAHAAAINLRPFDSFGVSHGGEPSLQQVLDVLIEPDIDAVTGQTDAALFQLSGGDSAATMIIEIAGFAPRNEFGIYDATNPELMAVVFDGPASAGARVGISIAGGDVFVDGISSGLVGFGNSFGFYLTTPQDQTFYSEDDLNAGGLAQALIYQGTGENTLALDELPGGQFPRTLFTQDMFLIAFEDLVRAAGGSDSDFQDMVVLAEGMAPIPEPHSAILFCVGALLVTGAVRKTLRANA